MDGPTPDHTLLPLSPAGSSGRFESVIKGPTHAPSAKLWNQVSVAPHTQTLLWSDTGRVPAFHLAAPPRVRRWSRRSRLYSVWVPGKSATQLISLAPVDHLTQLRDSVRPAFSQVPPHSSKGLCGENHCDGRDGAGPSCRYEDRVLQPLLHCAQESRWVKTNLGSALPELGKLPFKRLTQKCIFGCIRP